MSRPSTALVATPSKTMSDASSTTTRPANHRTEIPPSPGTFRHPRFTEIIKRQAASSLTSRNIQDALINIVAIAATIQFGDSLSNIINKTLRLASIPPAALDAHILVLLIRFLFFANTIICLRPALPYISRKDNIVDIPLTPSQRALLGLAPSLPGSPASAVSHSGYITPPRYRRDGGINASTSVTQNSPLAFSTGRRSISANYSSSPLSTPRHVLGLSPSPHQNQTQSARAYRRASDSPFENSPSSGSMLQRATTHDLNHSTFTTVGGRASFGTSVSSFGPGISRSHSLRERKGGTDDDILPGTPSPSGPKRQLGVNYKWLYDKGARLPRSESTAF